MFDQNAESYGWYVHRDEGRSEGRQDDLSLVRPVQVTDRKVPKNV
jgi:hypothetical protein